MSNTREYKIVYTIEHEPEGRTKAQLEADPRPIGACDQVIIHSIILPEDGSRSELIVSMDGQTGEDIDDNDMFKSWLMMAHQLSGSQTLSEGKRKFCEATFDIIRDALSLGRCNHTNCACSEEPNPNPKPN